MKFFSFFLPQFHTIPENDEWWGKGFTEWVNVKAAKPLYKNHIQPKHPLDDNYYNLLDKETVIHQTELMQKYELTGMIYYHYYFNGKLLLEKPAENLLKWKEIDQPFFFCWANHSWIRSWNGSKTVLLKQEYGNVSDWEMHFQYLLPFFKDSRYEKKNNMPLFMIFYSDFPEREIMFQYFDKRCKDMGFDGIYLIETYFGKSEGKKLNKGFEVFRKQCCSVTKTAFVREPDTSSAAYHLSRKCDFLAKTYKKVFLIIHKIIKKPYLYRRDGSKLYKKMINECSELDALHGLFFEWDNTPRHKKRGSVISPPSKELVFEYLNKIHDEDYVFVNAWNEWCEGMMLEPTKENGYKYLEWINEWIRQNNS